MSRKTVYRCTRRLTLESLETRRVCAGNVTAVVENGVLVVRGDGENNGIHIDQILNPRSTGEWQGAKYEISTYNRYMRKPPNSDTTINGQETVIVEGIKNGFDVQLGYGDDGLYISRSQAKATGGHSSKYANVPGDLKIDLGGGWDYLDLQVNNNRNAEIKLGEGSDVAHLNRSTFRDLDLTGETIDDEIYGRDAVSGVFNAKGNVSIDLSGGDDFINGILHNYVATGGIASKIQGELSIKMGTGNDYLRVGGVHPDPPGTLNYVVPEVGSLKIDLGNDEDSLTIEGIHVLGDMTVNAGAGEDSIEYKTLVVDGVFSSDSGHQDDKVRFAFFDSEFKSGTLVGGSGIDSLIVDNDTDLTMLAVMEFEQFA